MRGALLDQIRRVTSSVASKTIPNSAKNLGEKTLPNVQTRILKGEKEFDVTKHLPCGPVVKNNREIANKMGKLLAKEMKKMPLITEVRQEGLLLGCDFDASVSIGSVIKKACEEQSMITHSCGANSIRIIPALNVKESEVEIFHDRIHNVLSDLQKNGDPLKGKDRKVM